MCQEDRQVVNRREMKEKATNDFVSQLTDLLCACVTFAIVHPLSESSHPGYSPRSPSSDFPSSSKPLHRPSRVCLRKNPPMCLSSVCLQWVCCGSRCGILKFLLLYLYLPKIMNYLILKWPVTVKPFSDSSLQSAKYQSILQNVYLRI